MFAVSQSVVDLRREPTWLFSRDFSHDNRRDSQLLYGEPLHLMESKDNWCRVTAPLQGNYPGWVHSSECIPLKTPYRPNLVVCRPTRLSHLELSYGTLLYGNLSGEILLHDGTCTHLDPTTIRLLTPFDPLRLCTEAHQFLGTPYLWGGCSGPRRGHIQSVDCSGLIHLLYRAQGHSLPRDAKDQALLGTTVFDRHPADAIYLSHDNRPAHHVVLIIDEMTCIEAPQTGSCIRKLTWNKEIHIKNQQLHIEGRPPSAYCIKRFVNCCI